ncbi:hypothetical protein N9229_01850 [Saprospiraceae bacterium]|nr:hypothetical protein [Saprospiraceae bacterium]
MKNIFLIGTEHQYFQVTEAIRVLNLNRNKCTLIIEDTGKEKAFIKRLETESAFESLIVFKTWTFKKVLKGGGEVKDFIKICKSFEKEKITLWASHYDSDSTLLFLSLVQPNEFYLMDEGTGSFRVNHRRLSGETQQFKLWVKSLFYPVKIRLPQKLTYFSKYNLQLNANDDIKPYLPIKKKNQLKSTLKNEMIFLGSSITEVGLIAENKYLQFLEQVYQKAETEHCSYYPHRKEEENKLNQIAQMGFRIVKTDQPFEVVFNEIKEMPSVMSSFFCTSVLDNLSSMYEETPQLKLFSFDPKLLTKDAEIFGMILNHLKNNPKLQIVELS